MRRAGKQPGQSLGGRRGPRPIKLAGPCGLAQQRQANGQPARKQSDRHTLPPAQNDLALNGQVPPTTPAARRRVGLSARGAPAQRIGLRSPLLALRATQAKATATATASPPRFRASTRGRPPRPAGGCLPPGPRAIAIEQKPHRDPGPFRAAHPAAWNFVS
jgi:hypothetical protein